MARLTHFSELPLLPIEDPWFRCYRAAEGVTAIFEPFHFQEVISYLIEGSERCLLLDSGMGIGEMKHLVGQLTDKEVILCNSHSHFDHTGGNWQFGEARLLDVPECRALLEAGYSLPEEDENRSEEALRFTGERWFDLKSWSVRPCRVIPIHEGDLFDLGDRTLRVIATPGHAQDAIMLADDTRRQLFTGDTVYPAPLYAQLEGSRPEVYAATVSGLAEKYREYTLFCSHNDPIWEGAALCEISEAFSRILSGRETGSCEGSHTVYRFDGFSVIL